MNKNLVLLTLLLPLLALAAEPQAATPADTPAPAVPAPEAPAQARLPDAGVDEIDLEETDDSAEAAKRPTVKSTADKSGPVSLVDIDCDDATLADILRQFRKTTGANIISGESTNLARRVSVSLRRVPWRDALQAMLNTRGFRLEERGDINYVSEDKQAVPIITKTFALNHASCKELADLFNANYAQKDAKSGKITNKIANAFTGANVVVVTASEQVIRDCEAIVKSVDKAVAQVYIEARFLELSSSALHNLGVKWDELKSWKVSASNLKAGFQSTTAESANYGQQLSERTTTGNRTTGSTTSTSATGEQTTSGNANSTSGDNASYTALLPDTIRKATGAGLDENDMSWKHAYGFSGQLSASDFSLVLSAFEQLGEGKIFSNPRIIVSNGKTAKVDMTTKEPNVAIDANYTGTSSQNMSISTKLEVIPGEDPLMFAKEAFFSYGIALTVTPRISPDGIIAVEIVPTISEKKENKTVSGSGNAVYTTYPVINVKRLTTEFAMKDGSTAVIGGLTQTVENDIDSGIPYLRKIPWIGPKLFGWKSRQKDQNEIIVCVTVGIADPTNLQKDIGLPKNAVLGREYVNGTKLEPGDREGSASQVLKLDMRELDRREPEPKTAAPKAAQPAKPDASDPAKGTVTITPAA